MELIKLNIEHCKSIYKIDSSAFTHFWNEQNFVDELNTPTRKYYGVINNEDLIAYIGLDIVFENCDIIRIAVHKNFQNQGVAKKLLQQVFEILKKENVKKIMLEVSDKNTNAIKLYKSVGFEQIFVREKYYEDNSNALIFELNF